MAFVPSTLSEVGQPVLNKVRAFYAEDGDKPSWIRRIIQYFVDKVQASQLEAIPQRPHNDLGIHETRRWAARKLQEQGFKVQRFAVHIDQHYYDAMAVVTDDNLKERRWCLAAMPGKGHDLERGMEGLAKWCHTLGLNLLMVNGPGSGCSEGSVTWRRLGQAQEAGLQYLEKGVEAQFILIARQGLLGGAALGKALSQHRFMPEKVNYAALSVETFAKLSESHLVNANRLAWWALDTQAPLKGSRALVTERIPEVVVPSAEIPQGAGLDAKVLKNPTPGSKFIDGLGADVKGGLACLYLKGEVVMALLDLLKQEGVDGGSEFWDAFLDGFFLHVERWIREKDATEGAFDSRLGRLIARLLEEADWVIPVDLTREEGGLFMELAKSHVVDRLIEEQLITNPRLGDQELFMELRRDLKGLGLANLPNEERRQLVKGMIAQHRMQVQLKQEVTRMVRPTQLELGLHDSH